MVSAVKKPTTLELKETKSGMLVSSPQADLQLATRNVARATFGQRPVRTRLVTAQAFSAGGANSAYTSTFNLDITSTNDWASFAAIFDEVKCLSLENRTLATVTATASVSAPVYFTWAAAIDFGANTALNGIDDALSHMVHTGPHPVGNANGVSMGNGQSLSSALCVRNNGYFSMFTGRLPGATYPPTGSGVTQSAPILGAWISTQSSTITVAYSLYYAPALGANIGFNTQNYVLYEVEFRCRT